MDEKKSIDILGIKPVGDAVNTAVTKSFEGIQGFLQKVCVPALEEVGLLFKDKIRHWRLNNILKILEKAQGKLDFSDENLQIKAHPRVALSIIDNGSLNDNDEIQEMWAGLFVSSCNREGQDDENLIFVDLLKQITVVEAKILKYGCESARKIIHKNGLILSDIVKVTCEDLSNITGVQDIHRLDRELDHLKSLNLIGTSLSGGFSFAEDKLIAEISPSALALNLYLKTQGYNDDPVAYWGDGIISYEEHKKQREEKEKAEVEKTKIASEQMLEKIKADLKNNNG